MSVSLAFGLTVLTMAYSIGHISGCHLNPAVSIGLWAGGRLPADNLLPFIISPLPGGLAAAAVLYLIASGKYGFDLADGSASNGNASHSPDEYSMLAAQWTEFVMTMMFRIIIQGATAPHPPRQHPRDQSLGQSGPQHWRRSPGANELPQTQPKPAPRS